MDGNRVPRMELILLYNQIDQYDQIELVVFVQSEIIRFLVANKRSNKSIIVIYI